MQRQCYVTVAVKNTDYDEADEYVVSTTVNGVEIHGKCSPLDGAVVDGRGFFECVRYVPLPASPDGTYTFVTSATPAVNENPHEGSFVYVEYMVDCEGDCQPPSTPPPLPPPSSPPPPQSPTCQYTSTPAGGGSGNNATSFFIDPHAPMPLPPPPPPLPSRRPPPRRSARTGDGCWRTARFSLLENLSHNFSMVRSRPLLFYDS